MPVYCYFISFAYRLKEPTVFRRAIVKETALLRHLGRTADYQDCWPPNGNNQHIAIAESYTDVPSLLVAYRAHVDSLVLAAEKVLDTLKKKRAQEISVPDFE